MDINTKIALLGLAIAIIGLLIAVMTIQENRLRYILQFILCLITGYGLLELYYLIFNMKLHIWNFEEYNYENIKLFFGGIFWGYDLGVMVSAGIFYLGFPYITEFILHEKIRNYYLQKFNQDEEFFQKTLKRINKAKENNIILFRKNPLKLKTLDKKNKNEFEYDLRKENIDIIMCFHAFISILIFNPPFQIIFYVIIFLLLLGIIIIKPIMLAIADKLYP